MQQSDPADYTYRSLAARAAASAYRLRRLLAAGAAVAVAVLLAYHAICGANGLTVYRKKRAEYRTLQRQIQDLEKRNEALGQHVAHLRNDPDAIEHEARVILHYAKPGDVIYRLNGSLPPAPKPADR